MTVNLTNITGQEIDTIHVAGDQAVIFVLTNGEQYELTGMRLVSYDGELADLMDGHVSRTDVTESGLFGKHVVVTIRMSSYRQVTFNFHGGPFESLRLVEIY
jgi:hypothetical protein